MSGAGMPAGRRDFGGLGDFTPRTIIEPFRIKVVEPIPAPDRRRRREVLAAADYNPFRIPSDEVIIDLLTDSGTGAMSAEQWAAMLRGDESYAGSPSFRRFEAAVRELTGLPEVIPVHQGRAAEHLLFTLLLQSGDLVPNNNHFDTTRANVEALGGRASDLVIAEGRDPECEHPFKGNVDVEALAALLDDPPARVPFGMVTVTNNAGGGQPVSMANLRCVREVLHSRGLPFYLDACRFAENAWFIRQREPEWAGRPIPEIARAMFDLVDGATFSAKKDGLANIGGFLALRDHELAESARRQLILTEGFPTYGGLAGRDLEAIAVGLREVVDERYLAYRHATAQYLGERLKAADVPILVPVGGHAVYLDGRRFLPHLAPHELPGQALAAALYAHGGVRASEVGQVLLGRRDPATAVEPPVPMDLVRMALPRRTYTQAHVDHVIEVVVSLLGERDRVPGLAFTWQAPALRHFTARFRPLG